MGKAKHTKKDETGAASILRLTLIISGFISEICCSGHVSINNINYHTSVHERQGPGLTPGKPGEHFN